MIKVSLHRMMIKFTRFDEREFYISEYASWMIINIGPKGKDWWILRNGINGVAYAIEFVNSEDALAFRLKFDL